MVYEAVKEGMILRVRLTPNSSSCNKGGIYEAADGKAYVKISVVRHTGKKSKADQELIKYLSKALKVAKSQIEIVGGETDRCKKLKISGDSEELCRHHRELAERGGNE
ncbi:MAG: DUF167 family protein [Alphaproteobacteria bacterium]